MFTCAHAIFSLFIKCGRGSFSFYTRLVGYLFCVLMSVTDWQDDLQGRMSVTPPPGISSRLDRSPSLTPPEAWGGEPLERGGLRQPTMSRFACFVKYLDVSIELYNFLVIIPFVSSPLQGYRVCVCV